jgi:hypothetical protein
MNKCITLVTACLQTGQRSISDSSEHERHMQTCPQGTIATLTTVKAQMIHKSPLAGSKFQVEPITAARGNLTAADDSGIG